MSGSQLYTRKVMNKSGFISLFPNVANMESLLEGDVDIWAESATQLFPLGTKLIRGEQTWRYTLNGGVAGVAGVPVQGAAAAHAEQDDDIVVAAAAAAGAYTVSLTSTADLDTSPNDTADTFAEGYLVVNDEAGEGHLYKIKSNEAFSGTDNSTFTLYDPIKVALTTSSEVGLIRNPYAGVVATAAVCTRPALGVYPFAVTLGYYFWMPTGGPAPCVAHAAIAVGDYVVAGTTAAKADPGAAWTTESLLGRALTPGAADTETFIVFLMCDT
jgi:hypothetical protein